MAVNEGGVPPDWCDHANVNIEVNGLKDVYSNLMAEYEKNFAPNWLKLRPNMTVSMFGGDEQLVETYVINQAHGYYLEDAGKLADDYQLGLQALASAALYMAQQYGGTDDLSASDISKADANGAFHPKSPKNSVHHHTHGGKIPLPPVMDPGVDQ